MSFDDRPSPTDVEARPAAGRGARRGMGLGLWAMALWLMAGPAAAEALRIGIITDGPWRGNERVMELTRSEILALTEGEFEVEFAAGGFVEGDWTLDTARELLDDMLADPEIDLVITWGLLASHTVCCYGDLPKPVIAPVVIDATLQDLPYESGASGVANLTYVALPDTLAQEIETFRDIVPFQSLAILANAALIEAIPELVDRTAMGLAGSGIDFHYIAVGRSAAAALAAIPEAVEAVYVWPLFHLTPEEHLALVTGLNARRLPTFSALGGEDVQRGMLASAGSDEFFPKLARRIALNVQRILLGEPPSSIPVDFSIRDQLVINMATARAIGVSPRWDVLIEAELVDAAPSGPLRTLSLGEVIREAIAVNLDLVARRRGLAAGAEDVTRARAAFLPRLDVSATAAVIDDDRAAASFGSRPERSLVAGLTLSQLIYSDDAVANLEIQGYLQEIRESELEELRIDIALEAARSYLDLLRAQALLQVQRNNLALTRENLDLARTRRSVGAANPAEVYRWESEIAGDRKSLVEAVANRAVAEVAVNRLLNRDLEEPFATEEIDLDDPSLIIGQDRFTGYIETPASFELLREFAVQEGVARAPELARLRAAISVQERTLLAARRAYWAPTLGLELAYDERLAEAGAGSSPGAFAIGFPQQDESTWSLGVNASLPLFRGGERAAVRTQATLELERLRLEFESAIAKVAQRIRSAMLVARASYAGIDLARESAAAARQNLELVADAYARGALSIIDLLDAQNAALNADLNAANAVYDFFVDLMGVQRAVNRFDFLTTAESRDAWYERLERFFADRGAAPLRPPRRPRDDG